MLFSFREITPKTASPKMPEFIFDVPNCLLTKMVTLLSLTVKLLTVGVATARIKQVQTGMLTMAQFTLKVPATEKVAA